MECGEKLYFFQFDIIQSFGLAHTHAASLTRKCLHANIRLMWFGFETCARGRDRSDVNQMHGLRLH